MSQYSDTARDRSRICAECGATFSLYHWGDRFCSTSCRMHWHDARRRAERADLREREKNLHLVWLKDLPSGTEIPKWRLPKGYATA